MEYIIVFIIDRIYKIVLIKFTFCYYDKGAFRILIFIIYFNILIIIIYIYI